MAKQLDFEVRREQPLLHLVPPPPPRNAWMLLSPLTKRPSLTACAPPAPSHRMSRTMPLSPMRPNLEHSGSRAFKDAAATGIQSDPHVVTARSLSSHRPQELPPPRNSRAFFDVVLAAPVTEITHIAAADSAGADTVFQHPPSKPMALVAPSRPAPKKKSRKRKQATPEESESEYESEYAPEDESSDEDEPTPLRGLVKLIAKGRSCAEPPILTSDVRGTIPDTSCEETRRLFDVEYSTHKKPAIKRSTRSSPRAPKPKAEGVRKSNRLATRSATPFDADSSATDISVIGSSRSVSVASVRNPPARKPKSKSVKSKAAPRPSPSSNSGRDQSTPQPMATSMAYPPDDPPPPAPTHVVSLRPGYNAYTAQDKQWFLDFVAWVFRQNVHAGKAEICQDIFQQAPHHRLESWKSYWRDHISQVEVLRNQARDRLEKQTPPLGKGSAYRSRDRRSSTPYTRPSPLTIATPDSTGAPRRTHKSAEANKYSDGLWALAELAELERENKALFSGGMSHQQKIDEDELLLPRSKRPRY